MSRVSDFLESILEHWRKIFVGFFIYFCFALAWGCFGLWWPVYWFYYCLAWLGKKTPLGVPEWVKSGGKNAVAHLREYVNITPSAWDFFEAALYFLFFLLIYRVLVGIFMGRGNASRRDNISGVKRVNRKSFIKAAKKIFKNERLQKGIFIHPDIQMDKDGETEHFSIFGTTGAGKTKGILNRIFQQARERGDKVCLWDVKGDFTEAVGGDDNVIMIAPWDTRSVQWNIAADIDMPSDCDIIAESAIPDDTSGVSKGPFRRHARQILSALMQALFDPDTEKNELSWINLAPFLNEKKLAIHLLSKYESGKQVLSYFEDETPQSQATWSTLQDHAGKWINKAAKAWPDPDFSIREWLAKEGGSTLLVRYHFKHPELSASLCSMVTSLLINQVLGLPEDSDHKKPIWFIMDEMVNFPKVENLKKGITLARDRGGRFVVSAQDVTQLHPVYGKETTSTILNQCNTQIWLRCNDDQNAKIASSCLGSQEELLTKQSASESNSVKGGSSTSTSISHELRSVPAVHPGEIMALKHAKNIEGGGAHGFFKMSGLQLVTELIWPLEIFEKKYSGEETAEWVYAKEKMIGEGDDYDAE